MLLDISEKVILYGAHRIAEDTLKMLCCYRWGDKICGFAVTNRGDNPSHLCGIPVKKLEEYKDIDKKKSLIIVTMPEKFFFEITQNLKEYGYERIYYVGNKQLAYWENQEVIGEINQFFPQLSVVQDPYEYLCLRLNLEEHWYRFMPLGIFPLSKQHMQILLSIKNLWKNCGNPIDLLLHYRKNKDLKLHKMEEKRLIKIKESFQIYVATSLKDSPILNDIPLTPWEILVIGGAAFTDIRNGAIYDNEGENISSQNLRYAEMTVAYWAWKNSDADYIGLEHYRRRYILSEEQLDEIISQGIDAVLTRPRIVLPNVKEWFTRVSSLNEKDIERIIKWIIKRLPEDRQLIQTYFDANIFYPNNMVIAKKDVYGEYCQWMFGILAAFDREPEFDDIHKKNRCDAYIAEMLTSLYFILNCRRYRLAITDYQLLS